MTVVGAFTMLLILHSRFHSGLAPLIRRLAYSNLPFLFMDTLIMPASTLKMLRLQLWFPPSSGLIVLDIAQIYLIHRAFGFLRILRRASRIPSFSRRRTVESGR